MANQEHPKRHWRNYLLDARYQVTFTLPMVLLAAALFVGLGLLAIRKAESATKIGITHLEQSGAFLESATATRETLQNRERWIRYGIVGVGMLLTFGLTGFGVVYTHRVAGPLHRIGVELGNLKDGKYAPLAPLRKGDELTDLYEQFRRACAALRTREERDTEVLRRVIEAAKQSPNMAHDLLAELQQRLQVKESRLG